MTPGREAKEKDEVERVIIGLYTRAEIIDRGGKIIFWAGPQEWYELALETLPFLKQNELVEVTEENPDAGVTKYELSPKGIAEARKIFSIDI